MANRVIRSAILNSERVNKLSWPAEVFYRRLMSVVDDFGRVDARVPILRADLYALKLDKVSEPDIVKWMNECSEAGLIRCYAVTGKPYLVMLDFNQTIRIKKAKCPPPPDEFAPHMQADDKQTNRACVSGTNPIQSNPESDLELDIAKGFFRLQGQLHKKAAGDYWKEVEPSVFEAWQMQHPNEKISVQVLERMNRECVGKDFNDLQHMQNTFKKIWKDEAKPKSGQTSKTFKRDQL